MKQLKKFLKIYLILNFILLLQSCGNVSEKDIVPSAEFIPEKGTLEDDLWFWSERAEETIKDHPILIKDKKINEYVKKVFCKIEPDYCSKIRIYITRLPTFNASMFPNGMMLIHTGALIVLENEAQLASLLGHEFGHFYHRHSIKRAQRQEAINNAYAIFNNIAMIGLEYIRANPYSYYNYDIVNVLSVGELGLMLAQLSMFQYSRDNETEADMYGLDVLKNCGYQLNEAPKKWEKLIKMYEKIDKNVNFPSFTNTHPTPKKRISDLKERIEKNYMKKTGFLGQHEFNSTISSLRKKWIKDEIFLGEYEKSKFIIENLSIDKNLPGEKDYYLGEYFKTLYLKEKNKKKKDEYFDQAQRHFTISTELDENYPFAFLSLGSLIIQRYPDEGKRFLKRFVELQPNNPYSKLIQMEYFNE